ncbi:MAG: DUF2232 domain-containing protein [Gammaproteobacteria bacterium]|nr:DUF2232 domain-containing protein [Gammaproteobacteria bacterium]
MQGFLKFVTRSRVHASGTAALSLLVPPFGFVAAGLIGLVTLRYGVADGFLVLGASLVLSAGVMLAAFKSADAVFVFALTMGVPVYMLAVVLRYTASQGIALAAAGVLGGGTIAVLHLLSSDPVAWWRWALTKLLVERVHRAGPPPDPAVVAPLQEIIDKIAPLMTGAPTGIAIGAMMMLLLARWAHSVLDNPGGFGKEFRALRLDRRIAYAGIALAAGALFFGTAAHGLLPELFNLVIALYVVQGAAIVHSLVKQRDASTGWLAAMYLLLLLAPPLAMIALSVAGFSDTWLDYRARAGASV